MKCTIPEISWHNRDPVLSVDIQPNILENGSYRLASGGTDSHVLIWYMTINKTGSVNLDLAADLTRHQRAVNVVKWSPNGEFLASGDDESVIFIWKQKGENELPDTANEQDKEIWITMKILRGHMEDVYDLSWSPNSQFLISGSVDNTAMIWDVHKGKSLCILSDHKGFVQGVAWDPLNQYVATLCSDRYLRIFDVQTKKVVSRSGKCTLPAPEGHELNSKIIRIFHDDTLQTFFRRLSFSPDGKLLITPSGVTDFNGCTKPLNTTYIYSRHSLKRPAIVLPSPDQYTVAIKCCPILFKLRPYKETNPPVVPLPYRMIFAVATKSSVYLYDTQQKMPLAIISNIHYTRLTDLTWSKDAKVLVVSSTDGFCSLITFAESELGEIFEVESATMKSDELETKDDGKKNISEKIATVLPTNTKQDVEIIESPPLTPPANDVEMKDISEKETNSNNVEMKDSDCVKLPETLILDKSIISSVEKFDSPEKKDRPVTPISIRRHPRDSKVTTPHKIFPFSLKKADEIAKTPPISDQKLETQRSKSSKKATPIAVRRQPRVFTPNPVEQTTVVEEAVDAWPLDYKLAAELQETEEGIKKLEDSPCKESPKKSSPSKVSPQSVDHSTEDICLVYEESQEQDELKEVVK